MLEHLLSKVILISKLIELIASQYSLSLKDARDELYNSNVIKLFDDEETGLYGESPLYVLSLFEQEKKPK